MRFLNRNLSPRWLLLLFGVVAFPLGLYLWHRQGPHFGLRETKGKVKAKAALITAALLVVLVPSECLRR
jgi:hypothetical protein